MSKLSTTRRIIYLAAILIIFVAGLAVAFSDKLFQKTAGDTAAVQAGPEVAPTPTAELAHTHDSLQDVEDAALQTLTAQGVEVEFSAISFAGIGGVSTDLMEGEPVTVKFRVLDAETRQTISGLRPAAWIDLLRSDSQGESPTAALSCQDRVQTYLRGTLDSRPVIDLNSYFILALNDDASISVIDPMVDVGGLTQLYDMVSLAGPGHDWTLTADQKQLWVTVPQAGQVAVADMESFQLSQNINAGTNPTRLALQPDEKYAWVGNDASAASDSGVTVIDLATLNVAAHIPTGAGHHELAFSEDSRYAFVTNQADGTLSVIDIQSLTKVKDVPVGRQPVAVSVPEAGRAVYVADKAGGIITVVDGERHTVIAKITTAPGLNLLSFAPGGQWGLAANAKNGQVYIIDAAAHSLRQSVQTPGKPDAVTFSDTFAYVHDRNSGEVMALSLADFGQEGLLPITLSAGRGMPAEASFQPMAANVMFPTPDNALVIANPVDDSIYYNPEQAQAATGTFQGHGLKPRAVRVVDRSLQESAPGLYGGKIKIPTSGDYVVAFVLDSPRVTLCFEFTAQPNPVYAEKKIKPVPKMELRITIQRVNSASRSINGIRPRSGFISATSAPPRATSLILAPTATPTSAPDSARASFTPSPTIMTL